MAEIDASTQQYYALVLSEKSAGAEGVRRAKGVGIVRLLRSVPCEKAEIRCSKPEDGNWLEVVLTENELAVAKCEDHSAGAERTMIYIITDEGQSSVADSASLLIYLDLPEEASYMKRLRGISHPTPSRIMVTYVTPLELVNLKGYTQPDPDTKIKPLPELLPGLHAKDKDNGQASSAQPSQAEAPAQTAGSMHMTDSMAHENIAAAIGNPQKEAAEGIADELARRKEKLQRALDAISPHQNGSAEAAAMPSALPTAQNGGQNGHGAHEADLVTTEAAGDYEVPPPPLGSPPSASQAAIHAASATHREGAVHKEGSHQGSAFDQDRSPGTFQASPEAAGRRGRLRSAQEAAVRKEEQQELALERAILEIHWQQAEAEEDMNLEEAENVDLEEGELEGGELAGLGVSTADEQPTAAADANAAWHQHLPDFYKQWGRSTAGNTSTAAAVGAAGNEGTGQGEESTDQAAAWEDWYRQQGYGGQDASAQQKGPASSGKAADDEWQQWQSWQQQQQEGGGGGSAPNRSCWDQPGAVSGGHVPWAGQAAQGSGQEGFVSVPAALLQRYQMLEWAEWCRQYERWQSAYEQWYSWWSSQMWQYYGASTQQGAGAS